MASYCVNVTCTYNVLYNLFQYSKDYENKIFTLENSKTQKRYLSSKDEKNI